MTSSSTDVGQRHHDVTALPRHHSVGSNSTDPSNIADNNYQFHPIDPLGTSRMKRGNSQESIAESMVSLSVYPNEKPLIVPGGRYPPNNIPHRQPPQYSHHHVVVPQDKQNNVKPKQSTSEVYHSSASGRDNHVVASRDTNKPFYVTDL